MQGQKNKVVLKITTSTVLLSVLFHYLNRQLAVFDHEMGHAMAKIPGELYSSQYAGWLNTLLLIPILLLISSFLLYLKKPAHVAIPYLNTLALTFASISLIAGGGGQVELHFSIFMVVAMLAYYESIQLVVIMTVVFAIQHFGGYWIRPEVVFGTSEYAFSMVSIHVLFLVLTSSATIYLIYSTTQIKRQVATTERNQRIAFANELASRVSHTSQQISEIACELTQHADQSKQASQQIAASVTEIASGTDYQLRGLEDGLRAIDEMAQGNNRIASASSEVAEAAQGAAGQAAEGTQSVRLIAQQMRQIQSSVLETDAGVNALYEWSLEADQIIASIKGIADQTKLLALNAAIEATKAGDSGRGFTVVASEIRKLSEQAMTMAEQIAEILGKMGKNATDAISGMSNVKQDVETGIEVVQTTDQSFSALLESARQSAAQIQEISSTTQQIAAGSEQISASMVTITGFSRDFAEKTKDVADLTNQQFALIADIHQATTMLSETSQTLVNIMNEIQEEATRAKS